MAPPNGFEDRAGHQTQSAPVSVRSHCRRGLGYTIESRCASLTPGPWTQSSFLLYLLGMDTISASSRAARPDQKRIE